MESPQERYQKEVDALNEGLVIGVIVSISMVVVLATVLCMIK